MIAYMTLDEFHQRLGKWIRENPEHRHELITSSDVVDTENSASYIPGSVLIGLDLNNGEHATLTIVPPKLSPFIN